jgi:Zn-dependent metalloprotease
MQSFKKLSLLFILILFNFSTSYSQNIIKPYKDKYGNNLKIIYNNESGSAHRVFGIKLNTSKLGIKNLDESKAELVTKKIIEDYGEILKIPYENLKIKSFDNSSEILSINYIQIYKNIPVLNSEFGYSVDKDGNVISLGADTYDKINISTSPTVSLQEAVKIAQLSSGENNKKLGGTGSLVVYPITQEGSYKFILCWLINKISQNDLNSFSYLIDANNALLVEKIDNTREDIYGAITGGYWPLHPNDTPVYSPFQTSSIKLYNISYNLESTLNTNSNGVYNISGLGPE